jgi:hypothetical protein
MDINKIFELINNVSKITESGEVIVTVFVELAISILVAFSLRMALIFKSAKIKLFNEKKLIKQKAIILNHIGLEVIITFIFSFLLLMMLKTSSNNLIMNMLFVPLLGQIVAIIIDDYYFIPKEADMIFSKFKDTPQVSVQTVKDIAEVHDILDMSLINTEDFDPAVVKSINEIKKVQVEHEEKIDAISEKCDSSLDLLLKLQKAGMNDKKVMLKQEIYECLNNGFVTPQQRDKIVVDYESYINDYNGNGEIQDLYEDHFNKLPVHEDRRELNMEVVKERRNENKVPYGKYDKKK